MSEATSRDWRIVAATLFSAALVVGAYMLARDARSPQVAQASAETALLQAIASKDSDSDGLPDWEETLYGTDPKVADSFHLGMTDGAAVTKGLIVPKAIADVPIAASAPSSTSVNGSLPSAPADGTLTAVFAKNFFTLFLAAKQNTGGADLTEAQMNDIVNQAISSLTSSVTAAPDFKVARDLTVSGSGPEALKAFAVSAEAVFAKNVSPTKKSEITYLSDAVERNDATALANIALIAKAYRETAIGLSVLPVPQELAADDLMLINAMMRISEIATDFTRVNEDPLAAILALGQYPQATLGLINSFTHIGAIYKDAGVRVVAGEPGASFVNLIENTKKKQKASGTTP